MHIGLIGGIGPAATDFYYRRLIGAFADRQIPLELTIAHADAPTLLSNLGRNDQAAQAAIFARLAARLATAGADCVAVTSIAGHFCMEAFRPQSPLPAVDMLTEVDQAVTERGLTRIGVLGTRTVMETRFYGSLSSAAIVPPIGQDLNNVHEAYVTMALAGVITEDQRSVFRAASRRLFEEAGVQAIMLGGTDLALAFDAQTAEFPLIDCAGIHADAIVRLAAR